MFNSDKKRWLIQQTVQVVILIFILIGVYCCLYIQHPILAIASIIAVLCGGGWLLIVVDTRLFEWRKRLF